MGGGGTNGQDPLLALGSHRAGLALALRLTSPRPGTETVLRKEGKVHGTSNLPGEDAYKQEERMALAGLNSKRLAGWLVPLLSQGR